MVSSSGFSPTMITWLPGMSLACSQISLGSAEKVSLSFCRLFLPTRMVAPEGAVNFIGWLGGSCFIWRRLVTRRT